MSKSKSADCRWSSERMDDVFWLSVYRARRKVSMTTLCSEMNTHLLYIFLSVSGTDLLTAV